MVKKQVQKNLKIFTERIKKTFKPKSVYLFGSFAYGKITDYSDIDIVVVSDRFKTIPEEKRLDVLYDLTKDLYPDFHVFGFTHEEFSASRRTTLEEVKQRGIPLL